MSHFHYLNKFQPESVTSLNLPGNTSCVLLKKETVEVRDMPMPILQPDGVLVKVICTDKSLMYGYGSFASLLT
jgi:D-xylulose reductase